MTKQKSGRRSGQLDLTRRRVVAGGAAVVLAPAYWKQASAQEKRIFIRDPGDFGKLGAVPGIAGVVRDANGDPVAIDFLDILAVRSAEADAEVEFDKKSRQARQTLRKNARTDPRLKKLAEKLDIAGKFTVVLDKLGTAA